MISKITYKETTGLVLVETSLHFLLYFGKHFCHLLFLSIKDFSMLSKKTPLSVGKVKQNITNGKLN
jgi:hypothetical protein